MRLRLVSGVLLIVGVVGLVLASDPVKTTNVSSGSKSLVRVVQTVSVNSTVLAQSGPNDVAVKQAVDGLLAAYAAGDAKALAASFTADGEYIDSKSTIFHGRKAIEDEFVAFFQDNPGTGIEIDFQASRPIAPGVISSDCTTRFRRNAAAKPIPGHCQLVCAREGDKWLIASLREVDHVTGGHSHHAQVGQLDWLIGEWIGEGTGSHVHFSCRWDEGGNFLLRDFDVQVAGGSAIHGTQRIGYDPISGHLKTWIFDSAGGYSEGYFTREGETWVVDTSGVTADGQMASTTQSYSRIDEHRISSELLDRTVGGQRSAQTEKLILVRKPVTTSDRSGFNAPQKN